MGGLSFPRGAAMTSKTRVRVCLFAFMALLWSTASWGQTTGTIRGTATDQTGAVVPGATVTATLTGTDSVRTVKTDKDGAFDIPELAVGTYVVDAEAAGFKKFVAKDVVVTI